MNPYEESFSQQLQANREVFADLAKQETTDLQSQVQQSFSAGAMENPDDYARRFKLGKQIGVSASTVAADPLFAEIAAKRKSVDFQDITLNSPATAKFLANVENSTLAQDDVTGLRGLEYLLKAVPQAYQGGVQQREEGMIGYRRLLGQATPEDEAKLAEMSAQPATDYGATTFGAKVATGTAEQLPNLVGGAGKAFIGGATGAGGGAVVGAGIGAIGGGAPGAAAGATAGAVRGGVLGAKAGYAFDTFQQEAGGAYNELSQIKVDGQPADPNAVKAASVIVGAINAGLEMTSVETVLKNSPLGKYAARNAMKAALQNPTVQKKLASIGAKIGENISTEIITEVMQEATNIVADSVVGQTVPEFDAVTKRLREIASKTFYSTILLSSAGPALNIRNDMKAVEQAKVTSEYVQSLADETATSKLAQRAPEKLQEFFQTAKDNGAQVKNLYVDARQFASYFAGQNIDPRVAADQLGVSDQLDHATQVGGDVVIPVEKIASQLGGQHIQGLMEDIRINQADMSMRQAKEFESKFGEEATRVEQDVKEKASKMAEDEKQRQALEIQIKDNIVATKRLNVNQAGVAANIGSRLLATIAARTNSSLQDIAGKYAPQFVKAELHNAGDLTAASPKLDALTKGFITQTGKVIGLTKQSDISTVLHEFAHLSFKAMQDFGQVETGLLEDHQALRQWVGAEAGKDLTVDQQEKIAEGFEKYIMEGKAPTKALKSVFQRLKKWFTEIYKALTNIGHTNVELNDEVRGIFDHLLASEQEIAIAQAAASDGPLFKDAKSAGMTEKEYASYIDLRKQRLAEAEDKLIASTMKKVGASLRKTYREERKQVVEEVTKFADQLPAYQAVEQIRKYKLKISRPFVEQFLQSNAVNEKQLTENLPNDLLVKDGMHPDDVAFRLQELGYDSGAQMLTDIAGAPSKAEYIRGEVTRRMQEKFAPLMNEEAVRAAAIEEINSNGKFEEVATELAALRRMNGLYPVSKQEFEAKAQADIAKIKYSALKPESYIRNATKAANEAQRAFAKGQYAETEQAKGRQLLNLAMYKEAKAVKAQADKAVAKLQDYATDAKTRTIISKSDETLRQDAQLSGEEFTGFMEQIDTLLNRFSVINLPNSELAKRRVALETFAANMTNAGSPIILPPSIIAIQDKVNYKEMSTAVLIDLANTVENIAEAAKSYNTLNGIEKGLTRQEAKARILNEVAKLPAKKEKTFTSSADRKSVKTGFVKGVEAFHARLIKPEFLIEELDSGKKMGPVWKMLFAPVVSAENSRLLKSKDALAKVSAIFKEYGAKDFNRTIYVKEVDATFTKLDTICLALNWGNDGNREAVMEGYKWDSKQVKAVLDTLTKQDWETCQKVWDLLESYRPEVNALNRRLTGSDIKLVEASSIKTKFGTYKGGYFPLKYDGELSYRADVNEQAANFKDLFGANWAPPMAAHGHRMMRVGSGGQKVKLDINVVAEHIDKVITDLTHFETIRDIDRLLQDKEVAGALISRIGQDQYELFRPWLSKMATDRALDTSPISKLLTRVRGGASVANMGWKISTAITQVLGYLTSVDHLGVKWAAQGLKEFYGNPGAIAAKTQFVFDRSPEMAARMKNNDRDIRDFMRRIDLSKPQNQIRNSFFYMTGLMDLGVALPTWYGAYMKEMATSNDETKAIAAADQAVRMTQGSGLARDLAGIQRGTELEKLFTMFYSYFSVLYNRGYQVANQIKREGMSALPQAAASALWLWFLPAALNELIVGRGPKDDDKWLEWLAKQEALYITQTIPLWRDVANGVLGNYGYDLTPAADVFDVTARAGKKLADGKIATPEGARAAALAAGYWTGLPIKQALITGSAIIDAADGKDVRPQDFLFSRPRN